jgi:peptidoglycan/xylan/chitin deacetylase (PgdA/CDA1 family)
MGRLLVSHPPGLDQERRYAFAVTLGDWLGLDYLAAPADRTDIRIVLAGDDSGQALHLPDWFFRTAAAAWLEPASLPIAPLSTWSPNGQGGPVDEPLPVLFGGPSSCGEASQEAGRIDLPVDVFGSIFFLLSRYEEVVSAVRDSHDRFPAEAAFSYRHGLLERPLANEYLEVLWHGLHRLWPGLRRRARSYSVVPSHDIDVPFAAVGRPWRRIALSIAADLVHRKAPGLAARRLVAKLGPSRTAIRLDPNNCFAYILDTSERHGLKSTFFIKAAASDPVYDVYYSLEAPPVAAVLREIHVRGHELGLHPSYHTYRDGGRLKTEFTSLLQAAERLGLPQDRWGGRQHYLRFATPATWRYYAAAGLAYDATLALADQPGFRCSACYDFPVYDLEQRRVLPLHERPLTVMENTLLDRNYLGLSHAAAYDRIVRLAAICRKFAGTFNLLWHNNRLVEAAERRLYGSVLEAIAP